MDTGEREAYAAPKLASITIYPNNYEKKSRLRRTSKVKKSAVFSRYKSENTCGFLLPSCRVFLFWHVISYCGSNTSSTPIIFPFSICTARVIGLYPGRLRVSV